MGMRGATARRIEPQAAALQAPELTSVIPTLNERENIAPLLPRTLASLRNELYDLVVGSRYAAGGGIGEWDGTRAQISGFATRLSRLICKTQIADPMSGFFMLKREVFEGAVRKLSGQGFKILLDLIASAQTPPRLT